MDEKPIVSVSFLTTAEDYRRFQCESAQLSANEQGKWFFRVMGIALLAVGLFGALFLSAGWTNYLVWGFCLVAGLFFSFYYGLLEPYIVTWRAAREYTHIQSKLSAQTVEIFHTHIHITNPRADGRYPYELLYRAVRTEHFFLFFLGVGEVRMLPIRLLDSTQQAEITALLTAQMNDRFTVAFGENASPQKQ